MQRLERGCVKSRTEVGEVVQGTGFFPLVSEVCEQPGKIKRKSNSEPEGIVQHTLVFNVPHGRLPQRMYYLSPRVGVTTASSHGARYAVCVGETKVLGKQNKATRLVAEGHI